MSQSLKNSIGIRQKGPRGNDLGRQSSISFKVDGSNGQRSYSDDLAHSARPYSTPPSRDASVAARPSSVAASDDLDSRASRRNLAKLKYPPSASRSGQIDVIEPINGRSSQLQGSQNTLNPGKNMLKIDPSELANKLNELAVANADGLLNEDEYRMLRTAVFGRMMRADGAAVDVAGSHHLSEIRSISGTPGQQQPNAADESESRSSWEYLEKASDSTHPSASNGMSKYSRRGSIAALSISRPFSRESQRSSSEELTHPNRRITLDRRGSFGASSLLSNGEEGSRRPMSTTTYQSSMAMSSQASHFGRMRSGSQARRAQAELAARDMERTFSAERTARSLRAVSLHDTATVKADEDIHSREGLSTARLETGAPAMFGAEYADRTTAEIKAEMAVVKKERDSLLQTFTLLQETLLLKHSKVDAGVMQNALANIPAWDVSNADSRPPSAYGRRRRFGPLQSLDMNEAEDKSAEVAAFEQELADIHDKRGAVVKRYQDRLSFLQSKLRSAAIREGLKSHQL